MSVVNCKCGVSYKNTLDIFNQHTKENKTHKDWIKEISIPCGCGEVYNYGNQTTHFKSSSHKTWEKQDYSRYNNVEYICRCGVIYTYGSKDYHLKTHPNV